MNMHDESTRVNAS